MDERKTIVGLMNSNKQSSSAESDQRSHVQACLVHESARPAEKVTNEIVEIIDSLFTVEDLMAIRDLMNADRSVIGQRYLKLSLRFLPARRAVVSSDSVVEREELS